MSTCLNTEIFAIGSDIDVIATVADSAGNNIDDATVTYQLQLTHKRLDSGDPGILDEGPCIYDSQSQTYIGTIDQAITDTVDAGVKTYTFIFSKQGTKEDTTLLIRDAEYKES